MAQRKEIVWNPPQIQKNNYMDRGLGCTVPAYLQASKITRVSNVPLLGELMRSACYDASPFSLEQRLHELLVINRVIDLPHREFDP